MPFDLHIRIGGMCLLHDAGTELVVLLPKIPRGHQPHYPVLGSHRTYQPEGPPPCKKKNMVEHALRNGPVYFDPFKFKERAGYLQPNFTAYDVLNLRDTTGKKPDRPNAFRIRMSISHGSIATDPYANKPAWWFWKGKKLQLATSVLWTVPRLTNTVGGKEGIKVHFNGKIGYATLRPPADGGAIVMHLFHVLKDERLCYDGILGDLGLEPGKPAPHFRPFYDLFINPAAVDIPTLHSKPRDDSQRGVRYTCLMAAA